MKDRIAKAFTLIELLIVVAIIAILALIAVPNFLEAQVRSKVARCQADMRSLAVPLESYRMDNNAYPMDNTWYYYHQPALPPNLRNVKALSLVTTPIAYMTSVPKNPFQNRTDEPGQKDSYFRYFAEAWLDVVIPYFNYPRPVYRWSLCSAGPDGVSNVGEYLMFGEKILNEQPGLPPLWYQGCLYDPTNGTVSAGDIVRLGP